MTPLAALRALGLTIRLDRGALVAKPARLITPQVRETIRFNRDAIIADLEWEQVADAIAARAYDDDPFADGARVVMRESVILRWEGESPVATSPEFLAALEAMTARKGGGATKRRDAQPG